MLMPRVSEPTVRDEPAPLATWQRCVGHSGYIAEGVLYLVVGCFALLAALEQRQQPNGSMGALARLGSTWLGEALLALLALGLAGFVIWQLVLAVVDPEHHADRRSPRRRLVRLGHLSNGMFHLVFVGEAVWGLFGLARADNEKEAQVQWTARAMAVPVGRYVVALIGVGIVIFGLWQFYRALTRDKNKRVDLSRTRLRFAINVLGVYGLMARGTLFALVGAYLINAAWRRDPRYSGGIAGALSGLKRQPSGEWLLGVVAAGLICYGLYQVAKERYRRLGDG